MADRAAWDHASPPTRVRRSAAGARARPIRPARPDTRSADLRRLFAAFLSSVVPGLGQAFNRNRPAASWFLVPTAILVGLVVLLIMTSSPAILLARAIEPRALQGFLVLNLLILAWRLAALGQAFLDRRQPGRTGRLGLIGLVVLVLLTTVPHAVANSWGSTAGASFARVFASSGEPGGAPGVVADPGPDLAKRINVLVVGVDNTPRRTASLTDTMMVVSLDPVGRTVTIVSLPRDLVDVPLGNGDTFGPKLNSLMGFADRNRKDFPKGGIRTLATAVGALLGIPIDYHARIKFKGFVKLIDAVGGIDIDVKEGFSDPFYGGIGLEQGYTIAAGRHHFSGNEALAYARSRHAVGGSDFKRAERQQEILVAIRAKLLSGGSLFWRVPSLLDAVGDLFTTNLPVELLPTLASIADEMGTGGITRTVLRYPLVKPGRNQYGSIQIPDLKAILRAADGLFSEPGVPPTPWEPASRASEGPAKVGPAESAAP